VLKILIAEDNLMIADMAQDFLAGSGYEVCGIARTVGEAVTLARHHHPDLALIDLRLALSWTSAFCMPPATSRRCASPRMTATRA